MITRAMALVCMGLLCLCTLSAQSSSFLSGEIVAPAGVDVARLTVEITPLTALSQGPERAFVNNAGRFEARNLEAGSYQLRVIDERGVTIGSATATTGTMYGPVEIRVQGSGRQPVGSGKVSVKSLRADPNGKAERELQYGLWYARDKNWKEARKHFEKALKADAAHTRTFANWAALEMQRGNAKEAEALARKGLEFEPKNVRLLHALGVSLVAQGVLTDETESALVVAGAELPQLYLAAAEVACKRGQPVKANSLVTSYIRTGDTRHLQTAQNMACRQVMPGSAAKGSPETAQ